VDIESEYSFKIAAEQPQLSFEINMEPTDDFGLCCIEFTSGSLGSLSYNLSSGEALIQEKDTDFLSFSGSALLIQF
jgi:hypothetical protein